VVSAVVSEAVSDVVSAGVVSSVVDPEVVSDVVSLFVCCLSPPAFSFSEGGGWPQPVATAAKQNNATAKIKILFIAAFLEAPPPLSGALHA
jgi:hypothetical protein